MGIEPPTTEVLSTPPAIAPTKSLADRDVQQTACCIVGGGPAGVMLAFLLVRQGISVTLLEAHKDFDRDFRGDTLNPAVMEIMDELGLADRLLQLPHSSISKLSVQTSKGPLTVTDFSTLKTRYPYITVLPQARFLEYIITETKRYANFRLIMEANVQELIEEDGVICGIRYREQGIWKEVRSPLTIGADGRFSRIRQLANFEPIKTAPPMDVLWFRLPRKQEDPETANLSVRFGCGYYLALTDRFDYWQISYVIPKGSYPPIRAAGLEELRQSIAAVVPELSDRLDTLKDWTQISFLSVSSSRLKRWYRPGLLLIGDAAHVMSSVGGVGINCAIQDAVVAANVLSDPLKCGKLNLDNLAKVQHQREWPTRIMQMIQSLAQKQIIAKALNSNKPFSVPFSLRLPFVRQLSARITAFGVWPVRVKFPMPEDRKE